MTPTALIVQHHTPDLLELCTASLRRFAPKVEVLILPGGPGAEYHGKAINAWRDAWRGMPADPVILLDTDTVILSDRWWPTLEYYLSRAYDLVGGHRSRGEACQMFAGRVEVLHASMLAMSRRLFDRIPDFCAEPVDPVLGVVTHDTAFLASVKAERPAVLPFYPVTMGPTFPGLQVGEYFDAAGSRVPLWSHLWRGTGMPVGSSARRAFRVLRAACGSQSAQTMLRAEERKRAWMTKAWDVVGA